MGVMNIKRINDYKTLEEKMAHGKNKISLYFYITHLVFITYASMEMC